MSIKSRRVFSYIRFSSPQQAAGGSLARQMRLTAEFCQRKGLTLDESLTLHDLGVSAFRGDNVREGALAGFLEACRTKRVPRGSVLVVESLDRLSRDQIRPALQLFLSLQDYGITIKTHEPDREYDPESTDALALIEPLIVFARAHEESLLKSHRRRDGWEQAKARARQGGGPMLKTCPAWLEVTPDGFQVRDGAAAAVRRIYDLARDGCGVHRIAEQLTRQGVPPIGNGKRWVKAYVYRILRSPAPKGVYQPHRQVGKKLVDDGEPIPGFYPNVVSEEEWSAAQAAVQSRAGDLDSAGKFQTGGKTSRSAGRKGAEETNLFSGLLHDARSGERMHIVHALGRKGAADRKVYRYLVATQETGIATGARFDYAVFEAAILSKLQELDPADFCEHAAGGDGKDDAAALTGRLLDIDNKLARAQQRAQTAEDFDAFLDLIQGLQGERKKVANQLAVLRERQTGRHGADVGELRTLVDLLTGVAPEERAELRRRIKSRIRQLVASAWVLIVPLGGMTRVAAVQLCFADGKWFRSYAILHTARPQSWSVRSFAGVGIKGELDLRKKRDAAKLATLLDSIDPNEL
jgi:DNA invertase Pin-like site-specific DNA recombinase